MTITRILLGAVVAFLAGAAPHAAPQPPATLSVTHSFAAQLRAGFAPMIQAPDGTLFGVMESGGAGDFGAVFLVSPQLGGGYAFSILHRFTGVDGANPRGLTYHAPSDTLYGVTARGGVNGPLYDGMGTVFSLARTGVLTTLHDFDLEFSLPQPVNPQAPLLLASDGNFYGTGAGASTSPGSGAVFSMTPAGDLQLLHTFSGSDGSDPGSQLVEGTDGFLYGTTTFGGTHGAGTVFKIQKDGSAFQTLHHFNAEPASNQPRGLLLDASGGSDVFYGLAGGGGPANRGTIFTITPSGVFQVRASFTAPGGFALEGAYPNGALVKAADGLFYGTTQSEGPSPFSSLGTLFTFDPASDTIAVVHDYNSDFATGVQAYAGLLVAADGSLLGTTTNGGAHRVGTVYRVDTGASPQAVTKVIDVPSLGPAFPQDRMIRASDGFLYGTTTLGGDFNTGTIIRVNVNGSVTPLHSFNFLDGSLPTGELVEGSDGNLWGTTQWGGNIQFAGDVGGGTVFRIAKNGSNFTVVHRFENYSVEGAYPLAGLVEGPDGNFYGTTDQNGPLGAGTVFKVTPSGNLTTLHAFGVWSLTRSTLVLGEDGYFYGATREGGTNPNGGTLYKIDRDGNFVLLHEFTNVADGAHPNGLALGTDGNLYGTAEHGGTAPQHNGTLFQVTPTGTFTVLHRFDTTVDGSNPTAVPFEAGNGTLYGQTWFGGPLSPFRTGLGTLYSYDGSGLRSLHTFGVNLLDPGVPYAGLTQGSDNLLWGSSTSPAAGTIYSFDGGITNKAPVARHQRVITGPDQPVTINLTAFDPDGDPLTFAVVGAAANGTVSGSGPAFLYEPNPGFSGTDFFYVRVNDGTVSSPVAGVMITVGATNAAPVANDQSVTLNEDTSTSITLTGSDPEGAALSFTVLAQPAHGVLSGTAPNLTYTPAPDYNGPDSFTFKVNDGALDSSVASVSMTVDAVNDAPIAQARSVSVIGNTSTPIVLGATDADGDAVTFVTATPPVHGVLSGTAPNLTYTPNPGYVGPDSFTFKANDGTVDSNVATVSMSVTPFSGRTTTTLRASSTFVSALEPLTLTATVTPVLGTGVPAGEVVFMLNGTTVIADVQLVGGVATVHTNGGVAPVVHQITAHYAGGGSFTASSSAPVAITTRQLYASSFMALLPWNPSRALGLPLTVSAYVLPLDTAPTPTGTVQFYDGTTLAGTATLVGGLATVSFTPSTAGTHTLSARYSGSAAIGPSTAQPVQISVFSGAAPAPTTVALSISPNPALFWLQPVTLTATVTPGTATGGTVTFFIDSIAAGTAPVVNAGGSLTASLTIPDLPVGVRVVTASFGGAPGFAASNSALTLLVVMPNL